jgi:hypothetical protein
MGIRVNGWKGVGTRLSAERMMGLEGAKGAWSHCEMITIGAGGGKLSLLMRSGGPDDM